MTREDVIARFCALQTEVAGYLDHWRNAADCFCRDPSRGGHSPATPNYYCNNGVALEWIEAAVREKIVRDSGAAGAVHMKSAAGGTPAPGPPAPSIEDWRLRRSSSIVAGEVARSDPLAANPGGRGPGNAGSRCGSTPPPAAPLISPATGSPEHWSLHVNDYFNAGPKPISGVVLYFTRAMAQARREGWLACREACAKAVPAWASQIRALQPPEEVTP